MARSNGRVAHTVGASAGLLPMNQLLKGGCLLCARERRGKIRCTWFFGCVLSPTDPRALSNISPLICARIPEFFASAALIQKFN